ncbi:glutathione S-transferase [Hyaloraphidium curvatum]|nr:glutathione S-transferase [Hyaloraphidium curvatum]
MGKEVLDGATILYWNLPISRGQNVRLLFSDAGVDFKEEFFAGREFPAVKKRLAEAGINIGGTVPTVTLKDGRVIGQHYAAMRYLGRLAGGSYYPSDPEKALLVDEALDACQDWRRLISVPKSPERAEYEKNHRANTLAAFEKLVSKHGGPYLLGNDVSIADFVIYQMLADGAHGGDEKTYPNLIRLYKAVQARPGVQKLLKAQADAKKAKM